MALPDFLYLGAYFTALFIITPVLGEYIAKAMTNQRVFLTPFCQPLERFIYRVCYVDPNEEMHWKKYAKEVIRLSVLGIIAVLLLQCAQSWLPLNPVDIPAVPFAIAVNTAVSFVTNTNWQSYAGETSQSYLVQTLGLTVQNFLSAATGLSVLFAMIRGLTRKKMNTIGNFWADLTRAVVYILLPLSLVFALVLVSQGVIQNFSNYVEVATLEGHQQTLPMGPVASQIAIKQLGTNGGGFFAANSAHPFENPNGISNFLQLLAILLIPSALVYAFGVVTKERHHALVIYGVMLSLFLIVLFFSLWSEYAPNPALNITSALEGKELRFFETSSILWSSATTAASNGSVNAMHDSLTPGAGGLALLQIMLGEIIFGGVGSGLYGMLLFVLLTVFLSGLMVGRSPEYLGKKLEVFDMKMAVIGIVLPSAMVLLGAGVSSVMPDVHKALANTGPHGLSEILYAWASVANNNGSAFAGFDTNTVFFNVAFGVAMLLGRFGVIIPVLAIAGNLAHKSAMPQSSATLATDNITFGILLTSIIVVIGALTFFPSLALGPLVEQLLMLKGRTF